MLSESAVKAEDAAGRLRAAHLAITRLSHSDSAGRLLSVAAREACAALGFTRAMVSQIRGDRILFAGVSFEADPVMAADFARLARAIRPRLDRCAPEHEAAVRQVPVVVTDIAAPGIFRPLTHVARTDAYVVAPIVSGRRTVGLLHADAFGANRPLDALDAELLWLLATGIGWVMRDLVPDDPTQPSAVAAGVAATAADVQDALPEPVVLPEPALPEPEGSDLAGALTARELEVLQLMSEGASNASIGEALVISHATVKSHVRHILRKLGASNRTEAVSLYLASLRRAG
jgi:DNA-binding CsgD family transcriptional regulator